MCRKARLEVFTVLKIQVAVFWVVTQCRIPTFRMTLLLPSSCWKWVYSITSLHGVTTKNRVTSGFKSVWIQTVTACRLRNTVIITWHYLQHLVGTGFDAWNHMGRTEPDLFHLCKVVCRILIQDQFPCFDQGEFILRPDLYEDNINVMTRVTEYSSSG